MRGWDEKIKERVWTITKNRSIDQQGKWRKSFGTKGAVMHNNEKANWFDPSKVMEILF